MFLLFHLFVSDSRKKATRSIHSISRNRSSAEVRVNRIPNLFDNENFDLENLAKTAQQFFSDSGFFIEEKLRSSDSELPFQKVRLLRLVLTFSKSLRSN